MKILFGETKPGGQLLAFMLIFVLLFIISMGIAMLPVMAGGNSDTLAVQALSQIVAYGGTTVCFAFMFCDHPRGFLKVGLVNGFGIKFAGGVMVLILMVPFTDWLVVINDSWHFPQSMALIEDKMRDLGESSRQLLESLLMREEIGALVLNIVVLALLPALCEELFFRVGLQQILGRCVRNEHVAIWLTAVIFSLFHLDFFAFLPRFVLGLALGYVFYYGGSIWLNALMHFINNAIVVVLHFLACRGIVDIQTTESVEFPLFIVFGCLVAALLVFWFLFLKQGFLRNKKQS